MASQWGQKHAGKWWHTVFWKRQTKNGDVQNFGPEQFISTATGNQTHTDITFLTKTRSKTKTFITFSKIQLIHHYPVSENYTFLISDCIYPSEIRMEKDLYFHLHCYYTWTGHRWFSLNWHFFIWLCVRCKYYPVFHYKKANIWNNSEKITQFSITEHYFSLFLPVNNLRFILCPLGGVPNLMLDPQ